MEAKYTGSVDSGRRARRAGSKPSADPCRSRPWSCYPGNKRLWREDEMHLDVLGCWVWGWGRYQADVSRQHRARENGLRKTLPDVK